MDRQYENPRELECELEIAKRRLKELSEDDENYEMKLEVMTEKISELEDRINYAYQDEEYEEDMNRLDEFYGDK